MQGFTNKKARKRYVKPLQKDESVRCRKHQRTEQGRAICIKITAEKRCAQKGRRAKRKNIASKAHEYLDDEKQSTAKE